MANLRRVVGEYFRRHALCKDPRLMSRYHKPHENLLRTTQEKISTSDYTIDALISSDVQSFQRNQLLADGICGGWPVDAFQADVSMPSTEAQSKTVSGSELERKRRRARKKRRNENKKAQKAQKDQEAAMAGKDEDSRDSDRTVGGSRTPPSPPATIDIETVEGDIDFWTGGRAPPSSPVFVNLGELALLESGWTDPAPSRAGGVDGQSWTEPQLPPPERGNRADWDKFLKGFDKVVI